MTPVAEQADLVRSGQVTVAADEAAIAERRGATYWLLSRLVLDAPTPTVLYELHGALGARSVDPKQPLGPEVSRLADALARAVTRDPADVELRVEHTRLWAGLSKQYGPPPPYESVFREQRLPGDSTTAVASAYAEAGLDPEVADAGPADHLAVELRFMALCCLREAEARRSDSSAADEWLETGRRFLESHVMGWVPEHCLRVAEAARTEYHRAAAMLIARACELDRTEIDAQEVDAKGSGNE